MQDIHSVIRNLKARIRPEENLTLYFECTVRHAGAYACVSLAMEYLTLMASLREQGSADLPEELSLLLEETSELILCFCEERRIAPERAIALRERNISFMENTTDQTDLFLVNEYVLNRLEHSFEGGSELPGDYSDLSETGRIMRRLGELPEEEQRLLLTELFRQLPFRMSRQKFYDSLRERLSVYRESDLASLRGMIGLLRSAAGLGFPEESENELCGIRAVLSGPEAGTLNPEQYFSLRERLLKAGEALNRYSDLGNQLQRVLNQLVILALSGFSDPPLEHSALKILSLTSSGAAGCLSFSGGKEDAFDPESVFPLCAGLEGIPERESEAFREAAGFFEDITAKFPELFTEKEPAEKKRALSGIMRLLSDSDYAPLEEGEAPEPVNDRSFREETDRFLSEFASHAATVNRSWLRAEMAHMNGILPPRFSTEEALETYIFEALRGCSNVSEKLGCLDIISALLTPDE